MKSNIARSNVSFSQFFFPWFLVTHSECAVSVSANPFLMNSVHFSSRAAVVRGKVVTASGLGLFGVRVSSSNPLEGFTLTRDDGWFDLMVNGGSAVVLHFGRSPFRPRTRTVQVPWNEVVILDTVTMSTEEDRQPSLIPTVCEAHDYDSMRPVVLATWKHGFQGSCPGQSAILAESQVRPIQFASCQVASNLIDRIRHLASPRGLSLNLI